MLSWIGLGCLLYAGGLGLYANRALRDNKLSLIRHTRMPRMAFLIPARNESAVIEGLLRSIAKQAIKVNMRSVYVIVETLEDPTIMICKKYGCSVILRENLDHQRKGYALDEAIKQIRAAGRHYDLYFIFDADNRLAPDYLYEMLKTFSHGYEMAIGYRHAKNHNQNVIAAVSALTFSMINTLGNKNRVAYGANIIFSGTGCYIDGELIEKWKGWPFHSLTEDYEMSLYAVLHNISTFYNEKAVFYDEQPTRYRQTVDQRVRWIKGYFSARAKYIPLMKKRKVMDNQGSLIKESAGVKPVIWALIGVVCLLFNDIVGIFVNPNWGLILVSLIGVILLVYLVLMIITIVMIRKEKMRFSKKMKWKAVLFNPIYLVSYVPCALKALFIKDVQWKPIEHSGK